MLIAIMSDLHLRHWGVPAWSGFMERCVLDSIAAHEPDLVIDAGDWEVDGFHATLGVPVVRTPGNHDLWGKTWPGDDNEARTVRIPGLPPIITAPLWTDFNNDDPFTHVVVKESLVDSRYIRGYDTAKILAAHREQRAYINMVARDNPGAIVVTHHAPSWRSVHETYQRDPASWGFVSDMDHEVERSRASLWVHGHTHTPFDYVIGETRVLCNPAGYPHERASPYEPVYIEL